ncbi:MAG: RNA 2',3'-cyclic phosphodiesterase [Eubacteriaceae bacterium]|nr:RNA 2',3'-cyclic phosphodiesterase [Eubacteriaceae bacterium]
MRMFIAVKFDRRLRDSLQETIFRIKPFTLKGKFTSWENLHLTVVFLGDVREESVPAIKDVMDKVIFKPFQLKFSGIGFFRKPGGSILWIGAEKNRILQEIENQLSWMLAEEGFVLEAREYFPHLTLGRKIIMDKKFDKERFEGSLPVMEQDVRSISLMKSESTEGKLLYTEIYSKNIEPYR